MREVEQQQKLFPISELARRTGATKRVVEHAEARGLLTPASRTPGGYKLYSSAEERALRLITRLYAVGLTAAEIKALLLEPEERVIELLDRHEGTLGALAREATRRHTTFRRERADILAEIRARRRVLRTENVSTSYGIIAPRPPANIRVAA